MPTNAAGVADGAAAKMRYSSTLRCIGQSLEAMELKSLEIKTHGDDFIVQAWNRGPSMAMDLEKHYSPQDLRNLDAEGREKRKLFAGPPNLLSLSQVLATCRELCRSYARAASQGFLAGSIRQDSIDHRAMGACPTGYGSE